MLTHGVDIAALQEWVRGRDSILRDLRSRGLSYCRPAEGGGPIVYTDRFSALHCRAVTLARREFVGHLPGRKNRLPASIANLTVLHDDQTGGELAVINFHLTAEVQSGGKYRRDLAHRLRVQRHKRERRRLSREVRRQQRRGREVFALGDTNYHGMPLPPLRSCWRGREGGTLGHRAVDVVYAGTEADVVRTVVTGSDHRAVVVAYKG
ncbi:MAG TPA: hypothetical protein VD864_03385 [Nocardioides sp.]|nr:hypothetical protein [Nocardioides sp.]